MIHEHCIGHGLGLQDVACCQFKCKIKENGWCPKGDIGDECCGNWECNGYTDLINSDIRCCNGQCSDSIFTDYLGIKWCEEECKAGLFCPHGSCDDNFVQGQECICDQQCAGNNGLAPGDSKCCNGKCQILSQDWTASGIGYCPSECKAGALCPAGSCGDNFEEGAACSCNEQCGFPNSGRGCCNGQCQRLQAHWGSISDTPDYCPWACQQGPLCPMGSCVDILKVSGESCVCDDQCDGDLGCCNGICTTKIVDYLGIIAYCPDECKKGLLCPAGSCSDNFGVGQSCSCDEQCSGTLSCCDGICSQKVVDYLGVTAYCPNECKAGLYCAAGTCGTEGTVSQGFYCSCDESCAGDMQCCYNKCQVMQIGYAGFKHCPAQLHDVPIPLLLGHVPPYPHPPLHSFGQYNTFAQSYCLY